MDPLCYAQRNVIQLLNVISLGFIEPQLVHFSCQGSVYLRNFSFLRVSFERIQVVIGLFT